MANVTALLTFIYTRTRPNVRKRSPRCVGREEEKRMIHDGSVKKKERGKIQVILST